MQFSHKSVKDLRTWAIFCCFARQISRGCVKDRVTITQTGTVIWHASITGRVLTCCAQCRDFFCPQVMIYFTHCRLLPADLAPLIASHPWRFESPLKQKASLRCFIQSSVQSIKKEGNKESACQWERKPANSAHTPTWPNSECMFPRDYMHLKLAPAFPLSLSLVTGLPCNSDATLYGSPCQHSGGVIIWVS